MITVEDVLREYQRLGCAEKTARTRRTDASGLRRVEEALGKRRVDRQGAAQGSALMLRGTDVTQYRQARRAAGVSASTVGRELAVASAACRWCASELDWDIVNPFEGRAMTKADRRAQKPRARVLSQEESARLVLAAKQPLADMLVFMLETALRRGEVMALTRDRLAGAFIVFEPGDQKSRRHGLRALSELADTIARRQPDSEFLFTENGRPVSEDRFEYLFEQARRRSGVDCTSHDLRRTWAHRAREAGVSLQDIAAQLGHASTRTTESVYAQAGAEAVLRAVRRTA